MLDKNHQQRREWERLDRDQLETLQLAKLNALCERILPHSAFWAERIPRRLLPLRSWNDFRSMAYTSKADLVGGSDAVYTHNLTFPTERYVRLHRTSGTHGHPLAVLDTASDWQWWIDTWQFVLDAADVDVRDRVLMAFSFGPFIGFWSAYDAVLARGALVIPGGGQSSLARLGMLQSYSVTAIFCTPSYALHLAEVGEQQEIDVARLGVRKIIVAGEPGGSAPGTRARIEAAWGARVIDHAGATEVGPWGYADSQGRGLRIVETEFIAEFRSLETGDPAAEHELSELVLTSLGRDGCPVIRYRTGDLVRPSWPAEETNRFVLLTEGVLGRVDDMLIIRGVNVFPAAVENILRTFPDIVEFRLTATKHGELDELSVEVEDRRGEPQRVARELQLRLGLRVDVQLVPPGSLPRFEGKGRRFVDARPRPGVTTRSVSTGNG
ncbi:MAG: phenylacetate--CoA ligase family protein [Pirellulaceae bacterium]